MLQDDFCGTGGEKPGFESLLLSLNRTDPSLPVGIRVFFPDDSSVQAGNKGKQHVAVRFIRFVHGFCTPEHGESVSVHQDIGIADQTIGSIRIDRFFADYDIADPALLQIIISVLYNNIIAETNPPQKISTCEKSETNVK